QVQGAVAGDAQFHCADDNFFRPAAAIPHLAKRSRKSLWGFCGAVHAIPGAAVVASISPGLAFLGKAFVRPPSAARWRSVCARSFAS
ncbi:MAG: hypothetical protein OXE54_09295, partial [Gammaproteobacteria bacterium]|nr:hypothetical protein [Gammaproteobacteria bacterium]